MGLQQSAELGRGGSQGAVWSPQQVGVVGNGGAHGLGSGALWPEARKGWTPLGSQVRPRGPRSRSCRPGTVSTLPLLPLRLCSLVTACGRCTPGHWLCGHPAGSGSRSRVRKAPRPPCLRALVLNAGQLLTAGRAPRCYLPRGGGGAGCSRCRACSTFCVHFSGPGPSAAQARPADPPGGLAFVAANTGGCPAAAPLPAWVTRLPKS